MFASNIGIIFVTAIVSSLATALGIAVDQNLENDTKIISEEEK